MKRQSTNREKIFKVYISDKLVSRSYREHLQFVNKETMPLLKMGSRLNRHLIKEDTQMVNQHM